MEFFTKKFRKPLSLILAFCMFLSVIGVGLTVFAADVVEKQQTSATAGVDSKDMAEAGDDSDKDAVASGKGTEFDLKMQKWGEFFGQPAPNLPNGALAWTDESSIAGEIKNINDAEMAKELARIINEHKAYIDETFAPSKVDQYANDSGILLKVDGQDIWVMVLPDDDGTLAQIQRLYTNIGMKKLLLNKYNNAGTSDFGNNYSHEMGAVVYQAIKPYLAQSAGGAFSEEEIAKMDNDPYLQLKASGDWSSNSVKRTSLSGMFAAFTGWNDNYGRTMWGADNSSSTHKPNRFLWDNYEWTYVFGSMTSIDTSTKDYLKQYSSIENIPEKIPTTNMMLNVFKRAEKYGSTYHTYYHWRDFVVANNVNESGVNYQRIHDTFKSLTGKNNKLGGSTIPGVDTTSQPALKAFYDAFSPEFLAKPIANMTPEELEVLIVDGRKAIDEIRAQGITEEILKHFTEFQDPIYNGDVLGTAESKVAEATSQLIGSYKTLVNSVWDACGGDAADVDGSMQGNAEAMSIEELEGYLAKLDKSVEYYATISDCGKQDDVAVEKAHADKLTALISGVLMSKYGEKYDTAIDELVAIINDIAAKPEVVAELQYTYDSNSPANVAGDTADNAIKALADKYFEAAFASVARDESQREARIKPVDLKNDIVANAKTKGANEQYTDMFLTVVSGTKNLADKTNAQVTVINDPLWNTYGTIADIPASFVQQTSVYNYDVDKDGFITTKDALVSATTTNNNTSAKNDFTKWVETFTEEFFNKPLTTTEEVLDTETITQGLLDSMKASYSARILDKFLKDPCTVERVQNYLSELETKLAQAFASDVDAFIAKWSGKTAEEIIANPADMEAFVNGKNELIKVYNRFTDEQKNSDWNGIKTAYDKLMTGEFGTKVSTVEEAYNKEHFLLSAQEMYKYFQQTEKFTSRDQFMDESIVVANLTSTLNDDELGITYMVKANALNWYNKLTEAAKADSVVVKHKELLDKFSTAREEQVAKDGWTSQADDYYNNGVSGEANGVDFNYGAWKNTIPHASASILDTTKPADATKDTATQNLINQIDSLMTQKNSVLAQILSSVLGVTIPANQSVADWAYDQIVNLICSDQVVNMLWALYPLAYNAIADGVAGAGLGGLTGLVFDTLYNNGLALKKPSDIVTRGWGQSDFPTAWNQYQQVISASNDDWNKVGTINLDWGIDEQPTNEAKIKAFADALGIVLKGVNPLVAYLFTNNDFGGATVPPAFLKDVLPLLMNFGLDYSMTVSDARGWYLDLHNTYNANWNDTFSYYEKLITPLFGYIQNSLLKHPAEIIMGALPKLGYMLERGQLIDGIMDVLSGLDSLSVKIMGISINVGSMFSGQIYPLIGNMLGDLTSLDGLLYDVLPKLGLDLNATLGGIKLPSMNTALLSRLTKEKNETPYSVSLTNGICNATAFNHPRNLDADKADVFIFLLRYIVDTVKANGDTIKGLLEGLISGANLPFDLSAMIDGVLKADTDKIIDAVFAIFKPSDFEINLEWNMAPLGEKGGWQWTATDLDALFANSGTTNDKAEKALANVDSVVKALAKVLLNEDIFSYLTNQIFTSGNVNEVIKAIYQTGSVADIISSILGQDTSIAAFRKGLEATGNATLIANAKLLEPYADWAQLFADQNFKWDSLKWIFADEDKGITEANCFAYSLSAVLAPFNPIFDLLFNDTDISLLSDIVTIKGANGYANSIIPLLSMLGCGSDVVTGIDENAKIMSVKDYQNGIAEAKESGDPTAYLFPILNPLMSLVKVVIDNPVTALSSILPNLSFYIDNGGISKAIFALIAPVTNMFEPLLRLVAPEGTSPDASVIEIIVNLLGLEEKLGVTIDWSCPEKSLIDIVNGALGLININGQPLNIKLPELAWGELAGIGTNEVDKVFNDAMGFNGSDASTYRIKADAGGSIFYVLRYVFSIINAESAVEGKTNLDVIFDLIGLDENILNMYFIKDVIENLRNVTPDAAAGALINVLTLDKMQDEDFDFKQFKSEYENQLEGMGIDAVNVDQAMNTLDNLIAYVLKTTAGNASLGDIVASALYTDANANAVFTALYTNGVAKMDPTALTAIFGLFGGSAKPSDMAENLKAFPLVKEKLLAANDDWSKVVIAESDWGINAAADVATKGSMFANAISGMLAPFNNVIKALLTGEDLHVYGSDLIIPGANGYMNAILPVFGALGMTSEDVVVTSTDVATLKAIPADEVVSTLLLQPVFNYINRISAEPVEAIVDMLPNLAYFMNQGGLTKALLNLVAPITNATQPLLTFLPKEVGDKVLEGDITTVPGYLLALLGVIDFEQLFNDLGNIGVEIPDNIATIIEGILGKVDFNDLENSILKAAADFLEEGFTVTLPDGSTMEIKLNLTKDGVNLVENLWKEVASFGHWYNNGDAPFFRGKATGEGAYVDVTLDATDRANVFVGVLNTVFEIVLLNGDIITDLVDKLVTDPTIKSIIEPLLANLMGNDPKAFTEMVIKLLSNDFGEVKDDTWDMTKFKHEFVQTVYPEDVNADLTMKAVKNVDKIIDALLPQLVEGGDIAKVLTDSVYTDANVNALFKAIYGLFTDQTMIDVLTTLGLNITVEGVKTALNNYGYTDVANAINGSNWTEVFANYNDPSWGVNGNSDNFALALGAVFSPFNPLLKALLVNEEYVISLDKVIGGEGTGTEIKIPGAKGYENSIIPLLGALGCSDIPSYSAYEKAVEADDRALIGDVVKAIANMANNLVASSENGHELVQKLLGILPNLAYFLDNNGLSRVLENLLAPIENIADEILPLLFKDAGEVDGDMQLIVVVLNYISQTGLLDETIAGLGIPGIEKLSDIAYSDAEGKLTLETAVLQIADAFLSESITIPVTVKGEDGTDKVVEITFNIKLPGKDEGFTLGTLAGVGKLEETDSPFTKTVNFITGKEYAEEEKVLHNRVVAETSDTALYVFEFIAQALIDNVGIVADVLKALVPDGIGYGVDELINQVIGNISGQDKKSLAGALIKILAFQTDDKFGWDDVWNLTQLTGVSQTTINKLTTALGTVDDIIDEVFNLSIVKDLLAQNNIQGSNLKEILTSLLYGKSIGDAMNTIATAIYPALQGIISDPTVGQIFEALGLDLTPANFAKLLSNYDVVSGWESLAGQTEFTADSFANVKWTVENAEDLANAVESVFAPFLPALQFLLVGGEVQVGSLSIAGGQGYRDAIVRLLNAFGCGKDVGLLTPDAYEAAHKGDSTQGIISDIALPLLLQVENIADAPMEKIAEILPNLAFFMDNNGIAKLVEGLLNPLVSVLQPVLDIVKGKDMTNLEFIDQVLQSLDLAGLLKDLANIDISGIDFSMLKVSDLSNTIIPFVNQFLKDIVINGTPVTLTIPNIDWGKAAGTGSKLEMTEYGPVVKVNSTDYGRSAYVLLDYVTKVLKTNEGALKSIIGKPSTGTAVIDNILNTILNNVFKLSGTDLANVITDILVPDNSPLVGTWKYLAIKQQVVKSTPNLPFENYQQAVSALDGLIMSLLPGILGGADLYATIANAAFTPDLMNTIATAIFPNLKSDVLTPDITTLVKEAAGIDLTPNGFAAEISSSETQFASLKSALLAANGKWENVNWKNVNWGFKAGDQDGFVKSIAVLLRPLDDILMTVLVGDQLNLLNSTININGGKGYNNAVIPLLEALGCKDIMTASEYAKAAQSNPDNLLINIINPILNQLKVILASPIDGLTKLLPNLGYFIYNDGLKQLVTNIILPITDLLGAVKPLYDVNTLLNSVLDQLSGPNLIKLLNGLLGNLKIGDITLKIQLPTNMFSELASYGKAVKMTSKRVDANGKPATMTYIEADQASTLLQTLRFLVNTIKANLSTIEGLLKGVDLGSLGSVVNDLLGSIKTMDTDLVIEMIMSLLGFVAGDEDMGMDDGMGDDIIIDEPIIEDPIIDNGAGDTTTDQGVTEDGGLSIPAIIAIVVGCLLLLAAIIILIIVLVKRKKKAEAAKLAAAQTPAIAAGEETKAEESTKAESADESSKSDDETPKKE